MHAAVAARGWADEIVVGNDTFAVLRAGTERGWGVAVVCGAGINCVGVAPDGRACASPRSARSPATGAAVTTSASPRSPRPRAARTVADRRPRAGRSRLLRPRLPDELGEEIHAGRLPTRRLIELAPARLRGGGSDEVAAEIVVRLADEVVALARAATPPRARAPAGRGAARRRVAATRRRAAARGDRRGAGRGRGRDHGADDERTPRGRCGAARARPPRCRRSRQGSSPARARRRGGCGGRCRAVPFTRSGGTAWLMFDTRVQRASIPAATSRRSRISISRSPTAS